MATLDDQLLAAMKRDGSGNSESLIVPNHLQQMTLWMIRTGVDFYPDQDDDQKSRAKFIKQLIEYNRLDLFYKGIATLFLCSGSVMWYLRPTGTSNYEIHWFDKSQYRAYWMPGGRELQEVIIRYSYKDYSQNIFNTYNQSREKWVRLRITALEIIEEKFETCPPLDPNEQQVAGYGMGAIARRTVQNSLGFIPCVESPNVPVRPGDSGTGEFDWLSNQIEAEDEIRGGMLENIFMFGNPSLVTTRTKDQVMDGINSANLKFVGNPGNQSLTHSWAAHNGYRGGSFNQTPQAPVPGGNRRGDRTWGERGRRGGIARIFGGVGDDERFGYIAPDPINGDQWRFAAEYREGLHGALGGIDPLGPNSGATFGEVKSLYGKVAATALDKCRSLFTFGLCEVFSMAIRAEEKLFESSYIDAMLVVDPKRDPNTITTEEIQYYYYDVGVKPPGLVGLPPYGEAKVLWNHTGPVFEDSARDKLDNSIVTRNLQELGVGSLHAMKSMFPNRSEKEIKSMLTGVPFRLMREHLNSIGTLLQLQQQMFSVEDPINPGLPLSQRIDLTVIIEKILSSLEREMSYGAEYEPAQNDLPTTGLPNGNILLPNAGISGNDSTTGTSEQRGSVLTANSTSSGIASGLPASISIPTGSPGSDPVATDSRSLGQYDFENPIPSAGATLGSTQQSGMGSLQSNSGYGSTPSVSTTSSGLPNLPTDIPASIIATLFPELLQPPGQPPSSKPSKRVRKRK